MQYAGGVARKAWRGGEGGGGVTCVVMYVYVYQVYVAVGLRYASFVLTQGADEKTVF